MALLIRFGILFTGLSQLSFGDAFLAAPLISRQGRWSPSYDAPRSATRSAF